MKTNTWVFLGVFTSFIALFTIEIAQAAPASPEPSAHLRQLIDSTLRKINNISDAKQQPLDRTTLMVAQAEYSAKVQTASPAEQPVYRAALKVVADLVGAVEEHEKAVADYHYSKNLHGKQDREDSKVSNWQRGWDAGAAARADNAKQKMENDASRSALLDKEKFMNNGVAATWQQRVGQLHTIVEQSYTTELVAEQQLAMAKLATPAPVPIPKAPPKPAETSSADKYSPVGTWRADKGNPLTLKDDNTASRGNINGTWNWTDRSKGALHIAWKNGGSTDLNFPADGHALSGKNSKGAEMNFTRDN